MNELTPVLRLILVSLCSTIIVAHASVKPIDTINQTSLGWFLGAQAGALWANVPNSMSVNNGAPYAIPYNLDHYSLNTQTTGTLSLMGGYKWNRLGHWVPGYSLALHYQHFFIEKLNGSITQYSLPQFTNYNYSWNLSSDLLSLYSKIDLFQSGRFTPFFDVGLGVARNHTKNFQETALPGVTPRISPGFRQESQTNFAYNVGVGIDYALKSNLLVSLGYDYQDLGNAYSGNGLTTWAGEHLSLGHYKGNMVTVGLTYGLKN